MISYPHRGRRYSRISTRCLPSNSPDVASLASHSVLGGRLRTLSLCATGQAVHRCIELDRRHGRAGVETPSLIQLKRAEIGHVRVTPGHPTAACLQRRVPAPTSPLLSLAPQVLFLGRFGTFSSRSRSGVQGELLVRPGAESRRGRARPVLGQVGVRVGFWSGSLFAVQSSERCSDLRCVLILTF